MVGNFKKIFVFLSVLLLVAFLIPKQTEYKVKAAGNTYYVSRSGNNADGLSWNTAWNELNQINWSVIQPGDTIEIDGGAIACPATCENFYQECIQQHTDNCCLNYAGDSCGMVYNTTLSVNASGVESQPITIKLSSDAGRNGTAAIDGGVVGARFCPGYNYPNEQYPDFSAPSSPGNVDPNNPNRYGVNLNNSQWIVIDGTKWGGIEIRNNYRAGFTFSSSQNSTARYLKVYHNRDKETGSGFIPGVTAHYSSSNNTLSYSEIFANGQDATHPSGSNFTIEYCYLHDHYCYHPDGTQVYSEGKISNMTIRHNVLKDFRNLTQNSQGGMHGQGIFTAEISGHDTWIDGAQIYNNLIIRTQGSAIITKNPKSTNFNIYNNTIVNINGAGINWTAGGATAPMTAQDNIFYDLNYNIWMPTQNGKSEFLNNCLYLSYGPGPSEDVIESGTINQNPQFSDPDNDDYSLQPGSPCEGKGSSITSVAQLLGQTQPTPTPQPNPYDLNNDGRVGVIDLIIILQNWGSTTYTQGDFNSDGIVNAIDFVMLLGAWG